MKISIEETANLYGKVYTKFTKIKGLSDERKKENPSRWFNIVPYSA